MNGDLQMKNVKLFLNVYIVSCWVIALYLMLFTDFMKENPIQQELFNRNPFAPVLVLGMVIGGVNIVRKGLPTFCLDD